MTDVRTVSYRAPSKQREPVPHHPSLEGEIVEKPRDHEKAKTETPKFLSAFHGTSFSL